MRILVTGGAGYIGSTLVPMLIERGYAVRVVDLGMFGTDHVPADAELIFGDVLEFDNAWLAEIDAVIHLAGLSNDPMAAFSPKLNYILNAGSAAIVAQATKEAGIHRFVFASTCSVYGLSDSSEAKEDAETLPSYPYGISKLMAERALTCLTDDDFRPIVLRKGTVVGWSPRMRFDLVTNTMIKTALTQKKISVNNPSLWRPLLDVTDAARAYVRALDADLSVTGIFNVAGENYTIGRLADVVASTLREFDVDVPLEIQHRQDVRSYRVSTEKALQVLDFRSSVSMRQTVRTVMGEIQKNEIVDLGDPRYHNIDQMKINLANGSLIFSEAGLSHSASTNATRTGQV
jgi:nucleoside-diphosphate-sugar epimerase